MGKFFGYYRSINRLLDARISIESWWWTYPSSF